MIMFYYAVRDAKTEAFTPPFPARTHGEAIRSFVDAARDEKHQFNRHAMDYTLYHVGAFDDITGTFSVIAPEELFKGSQAVALDA